jgi:hypothetical protein
MWARIYLIPALQAEEDRDQVRRYLADQAREKELLGTQTSPYNSDRQATASEDTGTFLTAVLQVRSTNIRRHTGKGPEVDAVQLGRMNDRRTVHRRAPKRSDPQNSTTTMYTLSLVKRIYST